MKQQQPVEPITLPRTPFLDIPGAVEGRGPDAATPAHYGGFLSEQRPLARAVSYALSGATSLSGETGATGETGASAPETVLVDQGNLAVFRIEGADRLQLLDSLTSQSLRGLLPGQSAETLVLDANGRLEHAAAVLDDGVSTWLITEGTHAAALADWLHRMRFMLDVRVVAEHERYGVVATLGSSERIGAAAPNGVELVWEDPWATSAEGGVTYAPAHEHPGTAWLLRLHILERAALAELARRAQAGEWGLAGQDALEALRIAAWRPRIGREVDSRTIPHELDWLRSAVHLTKGCYRGQETVAKVHNLGRPPRRLVALDLDGVAPEPGAPLHVAGDDERRMVGRITSVGQHFEEGPIALALVKRNLDPATVLATDVDEREIAAVQRVIVPPDAGRTVDVPRLPRL